MLVLTVCDASSFRVAIPTPAASYAGARVARAAFDARGISWVGPPDKIFHDKKKGRIGEQFASFGEQHGTAMVPIPAE
eukprot:4071046-Pyramimonas_sp.AAC.1